MAGVGGRNRWWIIAVVIVLLGTARELSKRYGWDKEGGMKALRDWSDRMGVWAIPAYVGVHTLTLALCLPYAVFFEAAASLIFGFFPAVVCVFSAKVLGASLSFWIGTWQVSASSLNFLPFSSGFQFLFYCNEGFALPGRFALLNTFFNG